MAKIEEDIEINGTQYNRVIKVVSSIALWRKDIPLVPFDIPASGSHIIFANTANNHYYHIKCGSKWKEYI